MAAPEQRSDGQGADICLAIHIEIRQLGIVLKIIDHNDRSFRRQERFKNYRRDIKMNAMIGLQCRIMADRRHVLKGILLGAGQQDNRARCLNRPVGDLTNGTQNNFQLQVGIHPGCHL